MKLGVRSADGNDGFEYVGSLVYRRTPSGLELESAAFGGGRIIASQGTTTTYTPNYFLTDHLGSTRVVVDDSGTTQQRNDYYAFGERWADAGSQISDNRFLFSGKEDQVSLGLPYSDFGARMLDKKTGRWGSIDPLAKKYYPWSPYNYALNNPIRFVDPDGKKIVDAKGNVLYRNGQWAQHAASYPDVVKLGNNLRQTPTGRQQFNYLANHQAGVVLVLNTTDRKTGENGGPLGGEIDQKTLTNQATGKVRLKSAVITIYEKNAPDFAADRGVTDEQSMSATLGHEIEHMSDENLQQDSDNMYLKTSYDTEAKPKAIADNIVDEYKMQAPISNNFSLIYEPPTFPFTNY